MPKLTYRQCAAALLELGKTAPTTDHDHDLNIIKKDHDLISVKNVNKVSHDHDHLLELANRKWDVNRVLLDKWVKQHGKRYVTKCIELVAARQGVRKPHAYLMATIASNVGKV